MAQAVKNDESEVLRKTKENLQSLGFEVGSRKFLALSGLASEKSWTEFEQLCVTYGAGKDYLELRGLFVCLFKYEQQQAQIQALEARLQAQQAKGSGFGDGKNARALLCAFVEVPELDSINSFKYELVYRIGASNFVKKLVNYEAKNEKFHSRYWYIRLTALLLSGVLYEREVDFDEAEIHGNSFKNRITVLGKQTALYRVYVSRDSIGPFPRDNTEEPQIETIKTELEIIIRTAKTRVGGYLRLSGVYKDYLVLHILIQSQDYSIFESLEDSISEIGGKRKGIEYSKYILNHGIKYNSFDTLHPSKEMMVDDQVAAMFGEKDKASNEPKLGIRVLYYHKELWVASDDNISTASEIFRKEMSIYINNFQVVGSADVDESRHHWEARIENDFSKKHLKLAEKRADWQKYGGVVTGDINIENTLMKEEKENDKMNDKMNDKVNDDKKEEKENELDRYMLVKEENENDLIVKTNFFINKNLYIKYLSKSKSVKIDGKGDLTGVLTGMPLGGIDALYQVLTGGDLGTTPTRDLGLAFIFADKIESHLLKEKFMDELQMRFEL